jgi:hypothetical protein
MPPNCFIDEALPELKCGVHGVLLIQKTLNSGAVIVTAYVCPVTGLVVNDPKPGFRGQSLS